MSPKRILATIYAYFTSRNSGDRCEIRPEYGQMPIIQIPGVRKNGNDTSSIEKIEERLSENVRARRRKFSC